MQSVRVEAKGIGRVNLRVEHDCRNRDELRKALVATALAEGLGEEVAESLSKAEGPKVPSTPAMLGLFRRFQELYQDSAAWCAGEVDRVLGLKKAVEPLTPAQIVEIRDAISDRFKFVAAQFAKTAVPIPQADFERWKLLGWIAKNVTWESFGAKKSLIENAFVFGRLHEAVEKGRGFQEVMHLALNLPLLKPDRAAIEAAELRTAQYITGLGEGLAGNAAQAAIRRNQGIVRQMAVDYFSGDLKPTTYSPEASQAPVDSPQGFASELRSKFADTAKDWDRVAFTELRDAQANGVAHELLAKYGADQLVYKRPLPTACAQCKALYLRDDGKPRVFRLATMIGYDDNVGRKPMPVKGGVVSSLTRDDGAETLKPVAGAVHPWCECRGPVPLTRMEHWWDESIQPER